MRIYLYDTNAKEYKKLLIILAIEISKFLEIFWNGYQIQLGNMLLMSMEAYWMLK